MPRIFTAFDDMGTSGIRKNQQVFEQLAAAKESVTIDMSNVRFIDGSGIGAMVYVKRRLNANGLDVNVINATGQPSTVLDNLGLTKLFHISHGRI